MSSHLVISTLLLFAIVGFEAWRRVTDQSFGLLSVANMVFALNYCVSPLFLALVLGTNFEVGPFGQRMHSFSLVENLSFTENDFLVASLVSVLAFMMMIGAYTVISARVNVGALNTHNIPSLWLIIAGMVLGIISITALLLYAQQFRGVSMPGGPYGHTWMLETSIPDDGVGILGMLKLGVRVRYGHFDVVRGYLQIIVMLGVPAFILLSAAALKRKSWIGTGFLIMAIVVWLGVLVRVYHASGRMELTVFLVIIPLAWVLSLKSKKAVVLGFMGLMFFGLFMVLARHEFFPKPGEYTGIMFQVLFTDIGRVMLYLFNEFAFPFPIAAHTIQIVPEVVDYRYFVDVLLATLYMLPSIGGEDHWPEMISHIHERTVPFLVPYDLVSFGYYSGGLIGVCVLFVALGSMLAIFDKILAPGAVWIVQCLRAAWMMYLPFRIMYADPYTSMKTGFGLIIGTILVFGFVWFAQRKSRLQASSLSSDV